MDVKKYLLYGGPAIIAFAIGVVIGSLVFDKGGAVPAGSTNTYQAGWDAAKKRLVETGFAPPSIPEIVSIAGTVQEIHSGGMTVKIHPLEPLADPTFDMRTVRFDANTKFYQIEQKDPIKYQEELKAFGLKMRANPSQRETALSSLSQPFVKKQIKADDLKPGTIVSVTAGNNIKETREFVALEVDVQIAPTAPVVPVAPITPTIAPR